MMVSFFKGFKLEDLDVDCFYLETMNVLIHIGISGGEHDSIQTQLTRDFLYFERYINDKVTKFTNFFHIQQLRFH